MNKEIKEKGYVLTNGIPNPGYSTKELLEYRRQDIKSKPFRIKEWDFYQIEDCEGTYCIQLTYGHASYIGQVGIMIFDIRNKQWILNESLLIPLALNRMKLPSSASKDNEIHYHKKQYKVDFVCKNHIRDLYFTSPHSEVSIHLEPTIDKALIINIPFKENKHHFYYNYKLNCMIATGYVKLDNQTIDLNSKTHYGLLDWGRGVWPFSNEWYWSNGQGLVNNKLFGFNLGCGFGDTSYASENIFFYEGEAHKIGQVNITHEDDFMKPWILKDNEGLCDLKLIPEFDRITKDKILFVDNCTHQVFGKFYGTVTLSDGRVLDINGIPAFSEHAVNNW